MIIVATALHLFDSLILVPVLKNNAVHSYRNSGSVTAVRTMYYNRLRSCFSILKASIISLSDIFEAFIGTLYNLPLYELPSTAIRSLCLRLRSRTDAICFLEKAKARIIGLFTSINAVANFMQIVERLFCNFCCPVFRPWTFQTSGSTSHCTKC